MSEFVESIARAIEDHEGETEAPCSAHEAYARLKECCERAESIGKLTAACMKELWSGVKDKDEGVVHEYAHQLNIIGKNAAAAYAELASVAALSETVE